MGNYEQMNSRHQERFNALPMMFAFTGKQFAEGKEKLGVSKNSKLLSIGHGGYIRKADRKLFDDYYRETNGEMQEAQKDYDFCLSMFGYELANHEYCYTHDDAEVFRACGLTAEKVSSSDTLKKAFTTARKQYLATCEP
jgi:hypothetical protein